MQLVGALPFDIRWTDKRLSQECKEYYLNEGVKHLVDFLAATGWWYDSNLAKVDELFAEKHSGLYRAIMQWNDSRSSTTRKLARAQRRKAKTPTPVKEKGSKMKPGSRRWKQLQAKAAAS